MTEKKYSIEELMENETIASFAVSPDSRRILYSSDKTGNYNIFELDQEKGKHRQITSLTENALVSHVYKDGSFIFAMDNGGDELHHLYLGTEEKIKDLTPSRRPSQDFTSPLAIVFTTTLTRLIEVDSIYIGLKRLI